MNQFVLFKNAVNSLTALPVKMVSRLELALILEAGGTLVGANEVPVETLYPAGTFCPDEALELPYSSATSSALAEG